MSTTRSIFLLISAGTVATALASPAQADACGAAADQAGCAESSAAVEDNNLRSKDAVQSSSFDPESLNSAETPDEVEAAPHDRIAPSSAHKIAPLFVGDSRAVGMANAWGPGAQSIAFVGHNPWQVLKQIQRFNGRFADRDIYLSPGAANLMAFGKWSQTGFDNSVPSAIQVQLYYMRAHGADMTRVHILGVPKDYGGEYANKVLLTLAVDCGATFHTLSSQDLHPEPKDYVSVFAEDQQR